MSPLPAGTAPGDPPAPGGVHAIDGDGGSLCGRLRAGAVVQIDGLQWADIAREHRCVHCQLLMTAFGMGHL